MKICPGCGLPMENKKHPQQKYHNRACMLRDPAFIEKRNKAIQKALQTPEVRQRISQNTSKALSTPEARERLRQNSLDLWQQPGHREKQSKGVKQAVNTPEAKAKKGAAIKKTWENHDVRTRRVESLKQTLHTPEGREQRRQTTTEMWNQPGHRELVTQNVRAAFNAPGMHEKLSNAIRTGCSTPEYKIRRSAASKEVANRPEVKEARLEKLSMYYTPEVRAAVGIVTKNRWDDPVERERMMSCMLRGPDNPNWNGGSTFMPYCYKFNEEFKERVRVWFKYECVLCHKTQEDEHSLLTVHHVDYEKDACCNERDALFVTLCRRCHGKTNGNAENRYSWEVFFRYFLAVGFNNKCFYTKEEYKRITV